jgi:hypothetical protein
MCGNGFKAFPVGTFVVRGCDWGKSFEILYIFPLKKYLTLLMRGTDNSGLCYIRNRLLTSWSLTCCGTCYGLTVILN